MKRVLAAVMVVLVLSAVPGPGAVLHAAPGDPTPNTAGSAGGPSDVGADTWIGALSAIGCGVFVRATIMTGGAVVGTIVGAVATCGLMFFDALVLEP